MRRRGRTKPSKGVWRRGSVHRVDGSGSPFGVVVRRPAVRARVRDDRGRLHAGGCRVIAAAAVCLNDWKRGVDTGSLTCGYVPRIGFDLTSVLSPDMASNK